MNQALNSQVSELLRQMADVIEQQEGNPFRVTAYRRAAETVDTLDEDVGTLLEREGVESLTRLPFIGTGIASSIREIATSGRWSRLEQLRGTLAPERLFRTVPGIGPELAKAIFDQLHVDTLESLEVAAHDGTLESVKGVGPRRAAAVRASLASMLGRRRVARGGARRPDIKAILSVDRDYRRQAKAGRLKKIAPRRFNPEGEAWLPILHTRRGKWHFTALFSNTARAHQLGRTRDWVVIYYYDNDHQEGQCTVVSETRGPLKDLRVVRGREPECRRYYRNVARPSQAPRAAR